MPNEINITAGLSAYKASVMSSAIGRSISGAQFTMTGSRWSEGTISVPTSATAIPLAGVTAPHWAWFKNLDPTNYVQLMNGASGAVFGRLYPGEACPFPLDNGSTPYAIANTGAVLLEYLILQY